MFCSSCGQSLDDDALFCPYCGEKLTSHEISKAKSRAGEQSGRTAINNYFRKVFTYFGCAFVIVLSLCAILKYVILPGIQDENAVETDYAGSVIEYDNGDTVYRPDEEELAYDEDTCIIYYENLLIVYLTSDLNADIADELAEKVDGTVVGTVSGSVNMLQIMVPSCDLDELNTYADTLMESDEVFYATYDYPICFSDIADENPWSEDGTTISDKGDVDDPDGNDWWAEAIDAYSAWEYVDNHNDLINDISVGILDNGFDTDHAELMDHILVINENSAADHGTHVAGIIGAANNSEGIRGVADMAQLICADWEQAEVDEDGNVTTTNLLDSGEYVALTMQLIKQGAKVINNSWGEYVYSETGLAIELCLEINRDTNSYVRMVKEQYPDVFEDYNEDEIDNELISETIRKMRKRDVYEDYQIHIENNTRQTGYMALAIITSLFRNGMDDVLFVQAAGNGYDNSGPGMEACKNGTYAAITEDFFQGLLESVRSDLEAEGYTYETVKDHILIVGAVINDIDDDGNYKLSDFSNYGSASSSKVDICAPGVNIYSTVTLLDDDMNERNKGKEYAFLSGTSMAAPMVAGAAALVWSINPELTAAEVKEILCTNIETNAVGVGDDEGTLYPMLNVGLALEKSVAISNDAITVKWEEKVVFNSETGSEWSYNTILGMDAEGNQCWKIELDPYEAVGDFASIYNIGSNEDYFYYLDECFLKCIYIKNGELNWSKEIPLNNISGSAFDEEGNLYLGGVFSDPMFIAVDIDGNVVAELTFINDYLYYPCDFSYESGIISMTLEYWLSDEGEKYYVDVDTSDFSFVVFDSSGVKQMISESGMDAEIATVSFISDCVLDELGWVEDVEATGEALESFYDATGVQPYVYLKAYDSSLSTENEKIKYAEEWYEENISNERTFLYIFFAEEASDTGYWVYVCGEDASMVMDDDAIEIFWQYHDDYWNSDLSMDDVLLKTFNSTAEAIMQKNVNAGSG